ncbi:rRNA methyltransferase 3, mitochondrial isoform X1 [Amyelois transitella]|uniref:rRNA methyltransferase 3, mitochondrial isoform X1 n=2 Tax=Amyelois transitella TaxID=680683 RepID=UPI0029907987|nr:rRNA methyltransferase 3, mitochondrial isoform X1 [Amyelois transitella]XP_060810882.1 rRNA methyltransferase 3, mitochondrial isoform X1 [Amyelois transitella]
MSLNVNRFLSQLNASRNSARLYARWMNRDPAKVLLPFNEKSKPSLKKEKVISLDSEIYSKVNAAPLAPEETPPIISPQKAKEIRSKREDKLKKREFYLSQCKVFDDNNEVLYEKTTTSDGRISNILVKLKTKKDRIRLNQILVEGWRLIVDGLEAKCLLKYVIFSRTEDLNNIRPFLPKTGVKLFKVPYKEMSLWSDVETSPGIFGVFEMPTPDKAKSLSRPLPLQFICDNIRVPGNLGAILRIAVGAGCEKVLLTKGCVDMWDPKVIRSAAGAHFRLPIYNSIEWEDMPKLLEENTSVFIADSNTQIGMSDKTVEKENSITGMNIPVVPYYSIEYPTLKHVTLILGGETEGISDESYDLAARRNGLRLNIPLQRGIDSLNTGMATAIIAFEIRKQLLQLWAKEKRERIHAS